MVFDPKSWIPLLQKNFYVAGVSDNEFTLVFEFVLILIGKEEHLRRHKRNEIGWNWEREEGLLAPFGDGSFGDPFLRRLHRRMNKEVSFDRPHHRVGLRPRHHSVPGPDHRADERQQKPAFHPCR